MDKQKKERSQLRNTLSTLTPSLKMVIFFSVFTGLLVLTPSVYMLEVYGRVLNSRNYQTLLVLIVVVIGAYVLMETLNWVRRQIMANAARSFDEQVREPLLHAMFAAQLSNMKAGGSKAMQDLKIVCDFLPSQAFLAFIDAPLALVVLVFIFLINPVLGWFSVAAALILILVGVYNEPRIRKPMEQATQYGMEARRYAEDVIRNAQVIESMGMFNQVHNRWLLRQNAFVEQQATASNLAGSSMTFSKVVQTLLGSLLLGIGAWFTIRGELSGALMIVASILGGRVIAPLIQLFGSWRQVEDVRESFVRLERLLDMFPVPEKSMSLPAPKGFLQLEGVTAMSPETKVTILKGIGFKVPPGGALAVVGSSASGKTTLARILVGVWPSMTGTVRLDGSDISTWEKTELGPHIGYLPQNVELFDGAIGENIARFGEVDEEKLHNACSMVGLTELIESLPQGYDTEIGYDGAFLSGGQRQRVALARAVYGLPEFVVLDEPNANLDEAGDVALLNTIRQLKEHGSTVIIMTHRRNILSVMDYMLVLVNGMIHKFGPCREVLAELNPKATKISADGQAAT